MELLAVVVVEVLVVLRHGLAGGAQGFARPQLGFDPLTGAQVVEGVLHGLFHHLLHVGVVDIDRRSHRDDLLVAGFHVAGQHMEDAVGIDLELHSDPGHSLRRGFEFEIELAEAPIVACPLALALQHVDLHAALVVDGGGEEFARFDRNGGVAVDDHVHQSPEGLDAEGERCDIEQKQVTEATPQDLGLDGRPEGHRLIRILRGVELGPAGLVVVVAQTQVAAGLFELRASEPLRHPLAHQRHPGLSADQNDLIQVFGLELGIGQGLEAVGARLLDDIACQRLQLGPRDAPQEAEVRGEEGQLHLGLGVRAEADLGRFGRLPDAGDPRLLGRRGPQEIGASGLQDLGHQELRESAVEIVASQAGVAVGGQHLEDAAIELEDRQIEGAAAQVVHRDLGSLLELVEPIGQRSRRGFIDDAFDLESGQLAGPQGGVALGVVEIGRHGDHRPGHGLPQGRFGIVLELLEHLGGDLFRAPDAPPDLEPGRPILGPLHRVGDPEVFGSQHGSPPTHEPLGRIQGAFGVQHPHSIGGLAHQRGPRTGRNMDHRRGETVTLGIGDDVGDAAFHDGDQRVGGSEVDADDVAH